MKTTRTPAHPTEDWERQWWWLKEDHRQHVHEFSAAWEILRRTKAYQALHARMNPLLVAGENTDLRSHDDGVRPRAVSLSSQLLQMLPQSPPAPWELRKMVMLWQNMVADGWTPEKTYLEASQHSEVGCILPDGKIIRIPPTIGAGNGGVPIMLPRQVASHGHAYLFAELCDLCLVSDSAPKFEHLAGAAAPTTALQFMHRLNKPIPSKVSGKFIAIQFHLLHPVEGLEWLLPKALDGIDQSKVWARKPDCPDTRARKPDLLIGTVNPLEAIVFIAADEPRNLLERCFRTLIRPENIKKIIPRIREKWIAWDSAERAKDVRNLSPENALTLARADWEKAERGGRLAAQSKVRPIKPKEDLDNLACGDCFPFYHRNRSALPKWLPPGLRNDADLNKRIKHGRELVLSQDKLFLDLLRCPQMSPD